MQDKSEIMKKNIFFAATVAILFAAPCNGQSIKELFKPMSDSVASYMSGRTTVAPIRVDTVKKGKRLEIRFNQALSDNPVRPEDVDAIYSIARATLPGKYSEYARKLSITVGNGRPLADLADGYFGGGKNPDRHRQHGGVPIVANESVDYDITKGLGGRNIALWQSHGYYYEPSLKRWEWQRARMFLTVEDLYTQSYVLPFLVPMLENAGANVFLPRERDVNTNEVVVDNDASNGYSENSGEYEWTTPSVTGFADAKKSYTEGENPFKMGSCREVKTVRSDENQIGRASCRERV